MGKEPARAHLCFAGSLHDVCNQTLLEPCYLLLLKRPSAEHGLVEKDLLFSIRRWFAVHDSSLEMVPAAPSLQTGSPHLRKFREDIDAGAHVFTALCIMG